MMCGCGYCVKFGNLPIRKTSFLRRLLMGSKFKLEEYCPKCSNPFWGSSQQELRERMENAND